MSGQVIDQDGNPQEFQAHYWRHHCEYHDEFDSADDAMNFLHYQAEDGHLAACCVIDPDGRSRTVEVEYGKKQEDGKWGPDRIYLSEILECPTAKHRRESPWGGRDGFRFATQDSGQYSPAPRDTAINP